MSNLGKRQSTIDQDFLARQRVHVMCDCGKRARGQLTILEAAAWHEAHRLEHHPDRPDSATVKRTIRRAARKHIHTRQLTHGHRRDQSDPDELGRRETLRYKPGVEG